MIARFDSALGYTAECLIPWCFHFTICFVNSFIVIIQIGCQCSDYLMATQFSTYQNYWCLSDLVLLFFSSLRIAGGSEAIGYPSNL